MVQRDTYNLEFTFRCPLEKSENSFQEKGCSDTKELASRILKTCNEQLNDKNYRITGMTVNFEPDYTVFNICNILQSSESNSERIDKLSMRFKDVVGKSDLENTSVKVTINCTTDKPQNSEDHVESGVTDETYNPHLAYFQSWSRKQQNKNDTGNTVTYNFDKDSVSSRTSYNNSENTETNYVGLVNQAMTCYLNSLLQALYMTPEFRNALYNWEYKTSEKDSETSSIPFQLQKLFLNLQTSHKKAVETTSLTISFGWDVSEALNQHDIQELCRVMFDALEQKFKNTDQADLINRLYEGKIIDYVKCLTCNTEKSREDTFLDIPLPVKPFDANEAYGSVEEALEAFVKYETLEENNQYFCEKCNKKSDAHKGLKFTKFPYILTLQLKRFDFDHNTYNRIKLNDKVTFPDILNLNSFIESPLNQESPSCEEDAGMSVKCDDNCTNNSSTTDEESDATNLNSNHIINNDQDDDEGIDMNNGMSSSSSDSLQNHNTEKLRKEYASAKGPYIYELFSIMIHSGSASGGHYYAYIKDFKTNHWYCFNDQSVTTITQDEIQRSYGGGARTGYYGAAYRSSTNAYMLMYRQIDRERNKFPMQTDDFPPHIKELLDKMKKEEERNHCDDSIMRPMKKVVYFRDPNRPCSVVGEIKHKNLYIGMHETLAEVTENARNKLTVRYYDLNQCRIVSYLPQYNLVERTFDGQENLRVDEIFTKPYTNKDLLLDVRTGDLFEDYPSEPIIAKVYIVSTYSKSLTFCPKYIRAYDKQSVKDFKHELRNHFEIRPHYLKLYSKEILPNKILEDEFILESLSPTYPYKICATEEYIFTGSDDENNLCSSTFVKLHDNLVSIVTFYINISDVTSEKRLKLEIPTLEEYYKNDESTPDKMDDIDIGNLSISLIEENHQNNDKNCLIKNHVSDVPTSKKEDEVLERLNVSPLNDNLKDEKVFENVYNSEYTREKVHSVSTIIEKKKITTKCVSSVTENKIKTMTRTESYIFSTKDPLDSKPQLLVQNTDKEESNYQETSNSEDSSLSDSDRTLVGDGPDDDYQRNEFNIDTFAYAVENKDEGEYFDKLFKCENLDKNWLKISMYDSASEDDLKKNLESVIEIPKEHFRITEYSADDTTTSSYRPSHQVTFVEDKKYSICLGRVLQSDERKIDIYLLEMESDESLKKLCSKILKKNLRVTTLVQQLEEEFLKQRHLNKQEMDRFILMGITNDETVGDGFDKYCSVLHLPDEVCFQMNKRLPLEEVRVFLRKWNRTDFELGPVEVLVINRENFKEELMAKLKEIIKITFEDVEFTSIIARKQFDPERVESCDWKQEISVEELQVNEKTYLLYRDSTEKARAMMSQTYMPSKRNRIHRGSRDSYSNYVSPVNSSPRKEKPLKIHVGST